MPEFLLNDTLERDPKLNKLILDTMLGSAAGFLAGGALSIFMKKKTRALAIGTGVGAGIAFENNGGKLSAFIPRRNMLSPQIPAPNKATKKFWKEKPWEKFEAKEA